VSRPVFDGVPEDVLQEFPDPVGVAEEGPGIERHDEFAGGGANAAPGLPHDLVEFERGRVLDGPALASESESVLHKVLDTVE
jgi:hypothetical protein